jgi:hypothetical protein
MRQRSIMGCQRHWQLPWSLPPAILWKVTTRSTRMSGVSVEGGHVPCQYARSLMSVSLTSYRARPCWPRTPSDDARPIHRQTVLRVTRNP